MGRGKSQRSLNLIEVASDILADIQPASIRAVCYRLFSVGMIDNMSKNETNRVSTQLTWAREQGIIPWSWIVDETRDPEIGWVGWENPQAFMKNALASYRRDAWTYQAKHVEIWSEKGTVRGTVEPVLRDFGIGFRVMHGYASTTAIYQAAVESRQSGKEWLVLYVGDHDPSGLHMSEVDLPERLAEYGAEIELARAALSQEDVLAEPGGRTTRWSTILCHRDQTRRSSLAVVPRSLWRTLLRGGRPEPNHSPGSLGRCHQEGDRAWSLGAVRPGRGGRAGKPEGGTSDLARQYFWASLEIRGRP